MSGKCEHAIDRQEGRRIRRTLWQLDECIVNRRAQFVESGAGDNGDADRPRVGGDRAARLFAHQFRDEREFFSVDKIALREHDDRTLDVEVVEDRKMLERLRSWTFVCSDHQQQKLHPRSPREHVVQEAFVSGDVDDARIDPIGEAQMRETQIQRHAAELFLDPAVRIGSREGANER